MSKKNVSGKSSENSTTGNVADNKEDTPIFKTALETYIDNLETEIDPDNEPDAPLPADEEEIDFDSLRGDVKHVKIPMELALKTCYKCWQLLRSKPHHLPKEFCQVCLMLFEQIPALQDGLQDLCSEEDSDYPEDSDEYVDQFLQ